MSIIETPCGKIEGTTSRYDDVIAYKGIRYATANRYEYPVEVTHWDGVYKADKYGDCSVQPRSFINEETLESKKFYYNEFRKGETYTYSEDCLFLNIWTPKGAKKGDNLPVLFYIHGGGFTGGCGHEKHFDGPIWPTKGVIGVTINYRLGPLGFACLEELANKDGHTGNYGLYDQLTALKWINHNIEYFGGDKNKITIMGQSAGAMSVQQLVLSPLTKGLVSGAVMSSGGGFSKVMGNAKNASDFYDFWKEIMEEAKCKTADELKKLDVKKLFDAWNVVKGKHKDMFMSTVPVVDGEFMPNDPATRGKDGEELAIPYIMGSNSEDMIPPIIHKMAKEWCLTVEKHGNKGYMYFFDRQLPGDDNGAWHSSDLWYWFGTLDNCWRPMSEKDYKVSEEMNDYLLNFVKTGDPNGKGLPTWTPYTKSCKKILRIGENDTHMGGVNGAKLVKTMMTKKPVGE